MSEQELELKLSCLEQKVDFLVKAVSRLVDFDDLRVMTLDDVANMLGMSKFTLYKKRWLLPNFGETSGKMEWTRREVTAHLAKGTEALYREYIALGKEKASQKINGSL